MSVAATDIVAYTSTDMPTADTGSSGGAIRTTNKIRPVFTTGQISGGNSALEVASNGTSDGTKRVSITGRDAGGSIVTEHINISASANSYTAGATVFERVLFARITNQSGGADNDATGTITIRKASAGAVISTIAASEHGIRIVFYDAASSTSGAKDLYEKIYIRNNNASSNLTNAKVAMTADPLAVMEWGFAAVSSSQSVANRLAAPSAVSFITDATATDISALSGEVASTGVLAATEARGIWLKMSLIQNDTAKNSTVTLTVTGTTT